MIAPEYSTDQITAAVFRAIHEGELEAAVSILHILAVRDPDRAQAFLDALDVAQAVTR